MKNKVILMVSAVALLTGCAHVSCGDRCYSAKCHQNKKIQTVKKGCVLDSTSHFKFNSSALSEEAKNKLNEVVKYLNKHPSEKVVINGYTDNIGNESYNLKLSQKRANSVANYLKENGISASRITAKGYGETDFVACNSTAEGRAKNRRTEIIFVK